MSLPLTVPKQSLEALRAEGFEIEVLHGYLVIRSVPYVTPTREVALGTLACPYTDTGDSDGRPNDHTMQFSGEHPCTAQGKPIPGLIADSRTFLLFDQFTANHRFSNKPTNVQGFPTTYYEKVRHYVEILEAQARGIDPNASAQTGQVIESRDEDPIFVYPDSASPRAGTVAVNQRLNGLRVAIIGLGGTGSYILDQIVKTWVREIHLFDGDEYNRHNAFRAPGAASLDELRLRPTKVAYYAKKYGVMRRHIYPHPFHITQENIGSIDGFDFVFVCVDDGPSRKLTCDRLANTQTPFADVGLGLVLDSEAGHLLGNARVTMGTPGNYGHLPNCLPTRDDRGEEIYKTSIQVSEMNAMNALLAVMRFKQRFGFYADYEDSHEISFSVSSLSVVRQEKKK